MLKISKSLAFTFIIAITFSGSSLALDQGQLAPPIDLEALNGSRVQLRDFNGKLLYLDFWASWCSPCRQSFPWMSSIEKKYRDRGFEVLAINLDAKPVDAYKFLNQMPVQFRIAFDPKGLTPKSYSVKSMPTSFLIDRDGTILYRHNGFNNSSAVEIEKLIAQKLNENK